MIMRSLASTAAPNPQLELVASLSKAALHAATAGWHGDTPLDAGTEALAFLERFAHRSFLAASPKNAHRADAAASA